MVVLLRTVECTSVRVESALRAVRCPDGPGADGALRCYDILCTTDRLAPAHPTGPEELALESQGGEQRRRAIESRGDRVCTRGLGRHGARRIWPDRDDRAGRQSARAADQAGLDGTAAA